MGRGAGVKPVGPNSQLLPKNCSGGSPKISTENNKKDMDI